MARAVVPRESTIYQGDALRVLRTIPSDSVQCVVTSPPYWGLRDYNIPDQIGLELTLPDFMARLRDVFGEVRRVLRDDGLFWLNIGDGYTSGNRGWRAPDKKNRARAMEVRPDTPAGLKPKDLRLKNAAGREVLVQIAADPDITIQEVMGSAAVRHLIAVEVKGGRDFSNIHNRVGEAEKSHQKARADSFTGCWTIVNVDRTDFGKAKRESPSTDRFYRLSDLTDQSSKPYQDFRDRIQALTGT